MNAVFTDRANKFHPSDRKETKFTRQITAIAIPDRGMPTEVVILRFYKTSARMYACIWVYGCIDSSGSGFVGGGGYHMGSSAAAEAIKAAGIDLSEDIHCAGWEPVFEAVRAIAVAATGCENIFVTQAHA